MQQEELPEAQRAARGAVGTVPQQQAQGALRPARAQRADSRGDATEKNKKANAARHDETHQTRRALETARALTAGRGGTGPPRCLDNCAHNSARIDHLFARSPTRIIAHTSAIALLLHDLRNYNPPPTPIV